MSQRDAGETGRVYRRSEDLAIRSIDGDTVLMPVLSSGSGPDKIFVLNETGSVIWRVLAEPSRFEAIVEALEAEFAVGREQAEADAATFLADLDKAKLIHEV
jgi:hypothetical protein